MANRFGIPSLGFGMGLRSQHYDYVLENTPKVDWFEIISENYMDSDGRPRTILDKIRAHYPVVMHGVSLSIGSFDGLNPEYLKKLRRLADSIDAPWVSDHLCWTGVAHTNTHDLLPVPYTEESLARVVRHIRQVQDSLNRLFIIENPSTYMEFKESSMPEWEFLARLVDEANCGILLDANNVFVTCYNHGLDTKDYLDAIPMDRVVQIHLAGHDNRGSHIIDTHDGPVIDPVWSMYQYITAKTGAVSTMIEWDDKIPEFTEVHAEVMLAKKKIAAGDIPNLLPRFDRKRDNKNYPTIQGYKKLQQAMQHAILSDDIAASQPDTWIRTKDGLPPAKQLAIYADGYRIRLKIVTKSSFPALTYYLGEEAMDAFVMEFIEAHPSHSYNIDHYANQLPEAVATSNILKKNKSLNLEFARELATLELEINIVSDWQETKAFNNAMLQNISPDALLEMHLKPRAASKLLKFSYPMDDYFSSFRAGKTPTIPESKTTFLIIYRHDSRMWRLDLEEAEYQLLELLKQGHSLGDALELLSENVEMEPDELIAAMQRWFGRWTQNHLLAAIEVETKRPAAAI